MASKRIMYKPAPQENVGQRRNRKPLSQGRLISGETNAKPKPSVLVSGIEDSGSDVKKTHNAYSNMAGRNDSNNSPRVIAPVHIEKHSHDTSARRNPLDLSDSEDDIPSQYKSQDVRIHKQMPSEVLLIDALRQTKDPNQSEVDIKVGYERSPVRVVCHSPGKVSSDLRSSGNRSIIVDGVPTVKITKEAPQITVNNLSPSQPCRTLDNLNLLTQIEKDMRANKLPQPNFDDSQDSDTSEIPVHDTGPAAKDDVSIASESDACSVKELGTTKRKLSPSNKKKGNAIKKTTAPGKTPQTSKKKSSRPVASRYMQSANAKVKTSLSVLYPKTSAVDKSNSKSSRSMDLGPKSARKISRKVKDMSVDFTPRSVHKTKPVTGDTSVRRGRVTSQTSDPGTSMNQEAPHTPDNSHMTAGGQTSTPTHDGSEFPQEIDASAIHPEMSVLSTGEGSKINHSVLSNISTHLPPKKKKKAKLTQTQLDMIYARYIQSLYLATKAKKTREDQEKQAMAQIMGIYNEVEKLRKKNHELDKELLRLKHLNEVDQQIDLQRECLGPVVSSLPQLTKEYETLAHALDTTRHQIPTKGVYIPDDEDQYQRDLEQALLESEQLLGELSVMIRQDLPSVTSMSNALTAMEKATEQQCEELVRCNELLAATQSLTVQETSMKIQAIQAREIGTV